MKPENQTMRERMQTPEYFKRTILVFDLHPDNFPPGEVSEQWIQHDHWCALLVQGLVCDCDPTIEVDIRGTRYRVLNDGEMTAC
jgi:hypothetical protein